MGGGGGGGVFGVHDWAPAAKEDGTPLQLGALVWGLAREPGIRARAGKARHMVNGKYGGRFFGCFVFVVVCIIAVHVAQQRP